MTATSRIHDPYSRCEAGCSHDLAAGVLVTDLLGGDGPFVSMWVVSSRRGAMVLRPDAAGPAADESLAA